MEHPKRVGDRTTLAVMLALERAGYSLLFPFGENSRYDLVIDDGSALQRVQCKTGRLRAGAVQFNTCSLYAHHSNPKARHRDYRGEIDWFAVYCAETGGVYLVPIADVGARRQAHLRVEAARNGQRQGIRQASDYLIAVVRPQATTTPGGLVT